MSEPAFDSQPPPGRKPDPSDRPQQPPESEAGRGQVGEQVDAAGWGDAGWGNADWRDDGWQDVFADCQSGLKSFLRGKLPQQADVDDCLQSVFMAMLNNRSPIPVVARRAWLFTVAAREAAKFWRDRSTTDRVLEKHAANTNHTEAGLKTGLEQQEFQRQLRAALEKLPEASRVIVELRLREELTFATIAERLQLPLGTVLTRMRRAMRQLRSDLAAHRPHDTRSAGTGSAD